MNPLTHAKNSKKKHGGKEEDYLFIHEWIDQTKLHVGDLRHRVILHNTFGVQLCCDKWGSTFTNSDGKLVSVRAIAEEHIKEDVGFLPSLDQSLAGTAITQVQAPRLRKLILKGELT